MQIVIGIVNNFAKKIREKYRNAEVDIDGHFIDFALDDRLIIIEYLAHLNGKWGVSRLDGIVVGYGFGFDKMVENQDEVLSHIDYLLDLPTPLLVRISEWRLTGIDEKISGIINILRDTTNVRDKLREGGLNFKELGNTDSCIIFDDAFVSFFARIIEENKFAKDIDIELEVDNPYA